MKAERYYTPTHSPETLKAKPTGAPFGYYGSKQKIARKLISDLPPHNAWVEAFCGSAALTLAKPPSPIEIINDRDDQIGNEIAAYITRPFSKEFGDVLFRNVH